MPNAHVILDFAAAWAGEPDSYVLIELDAGSVAPTGIASSEEFGTPTVTQSVVTPPAPPSGPLARPFGGRPAERPRRQRREVRSRIRLRTAFTISHGHGVVTSSDLGLRSGFAVVKTDPPPPTPRPAPVLALPPRALSFDSVLRVGSEWRGDRAQALEVATGVRLSARYVVRRDDGDEAIVEALVVLDL